MDDGDEANDWSSSVVNVGTSGWYNVDLRCSAGGAGTYGRFVLNGVDLYSPILTQTASWDAWATRTQVAYLNAGDNTVQFGFRAGNAAFNYDYLEIDNPSGRVPAQVVINEILPDSLKDSAGVDVDEWVELYNASDSACDVSGWHLVNYRTKVFNVPTGVVMPSRSWLVVHIDTGTDDLDFSDSVGHVYARGFPARDMFAPTDQCGLYDASWRIIDFVAFGLSADPAADSDAVAAGIWTPNQFFIYVPGTDKSLFLFPDGVDTNSPDNWRATAQGGRASEGGTNNGMDVFNSSIESLDFMLPDWSGPLPSESSVTLGDTLYIQMQTDLGNDSAIDFVQVYLGAGQEKPIAVTLKETSKASNILRGYAYLRRQTVSAMDWLSRPNEGDTISVWDYEGPDRSDTIQVYGARVYILVRGNSSRDNAGGSAIMRHRVGRGAAARGGSGA